MKRITVLLTAAVFAFAMVGFGGCGSSVFGIDGTSEKTMTVTAENASADDFVITGTLEVDEGEEIHVEPALEKGSVELAFIAAEGMDDGDELPDIDAMADNEPALKAEAGGTQSQAYQISEGEYVVKATVLEKATGTIQITVK